MLSLHLHIHPPPQPIVERLSLVYLAWVSDVWVGVIGPAGSRLSLVLPGPHALTHTQYVLATQCPSDFQQRLSCTTPFSSFLVQRPALAACWTLSLA